MLNTRYSYRKMETYHHIYTGNMLLFIHYVENIWFFSTINMIAR